jgi:hypothetical protein
VFLSLTSHVLEKKEIKFFAVRELRESEWKEKKIVIFCFDKLFELIPKWHFEWVNSSGNFDE